MRLLFAHDHRFSRGPAGQLYSAGSFSTELWERFLAHFEDVHIIARDGGPVEDGSRLARADHERVTLEFFPNISSLRQLVLRSPKIHTQMELAVSRSDAVVARLPSEIGLLAITHARRLGKPYAIEVVGCAWDAYSVGGGRASLYAPLAYLRARSAIAKAPNALYVTSAWLQKRYPTRGWQSGVSDVSLVPPTEAARASRQARLARLESGERPVIGTIGTLRVKYKGIQTALRALASLRSSGIDLTYRLLGPGSSEPWRRMAEKLGVSDLVHFDGTRSAGAEVCNWLNDIDIYLQPSFQEGLPRGMVEAMNCGAACIGSTVGGIPELLPATRLHAPGDSKRLADLIRQLVADPGAVAAASRADFETASKFEPALLDQRRREFYARLRAQAEAIA